MPHADGCASDAYVGILCLQDDTVPAYVFNHGQKNEFICYDRKMDSETLRLTETEDWENSQSYFGVLLYPSLENRMKPCETENWNRGDLLLMRKDTSHLGPGAVMGKQRELLFFEVLPVGKSIQKENTQIHAIMAAEMLYGNGSDEFYQLVLRHDQYYKKSKAYKDPIANLLPSIKKSLATFKKEQAGIQKSNLTV